MEDHKQGDWVLYDDYAAEVAKLKARVAELEGALREIAKRMIAVRGMQDGVSPHTTREIIDGIKALKVQP